MIGLARPEVSKTSLGKRLRAVRTHFGDPSRLEFARRLGVTDKTLANHERGDSVPDADVLAGYNVHFGVDVTWLVTGDGVMFADPSKAPPQTLDADLLQKLARVATAVHRDFGIKLPAEGATAEAAVLYNELIAKVSNVADAEEVEAALPQLRYQLKKRLSEAVAQPGTGKRAASQS